jgi:hypothetical protein
MDRAVFVLGVVLDYPDATAILDGRSIGSAVVIDCLEIPTLGAPLGENYDGLTGVVAAVGGVPVLFIVEGNQGGVVTRFGTFGKGVGTGTGEDELVEIAW